MNVESNDIRTEEADDWGRLYLGTEYANKRVTVAVIAVETDRPDEEALAAAYRDASESADDMTRDWEHASDEVWDSLGPAPGVEGHNPDTDE
jgi:hypothetical protein